MSKLNVSHEVAADPSKVWAITVAIDDWVDVINAVESVERLDDGSGFGLGTKWRETRKMFGKSATEEMEVVEFVDGSHYKTFAESHGSKYHSEIRVTPNEKGCTLSMGFEGEAQSTMAKVMDATLGRLFMGAARKALTKDLADIGAAAEAAA